ncbi:arginine--tRNA ligase [Methanobrevibacter sp. 87.7]|uniref:arginine--tRNA ligase n=1 Tax=Methanobrevibacter sp. 87.7 TaxID=387957 RepID=UPI000B504EF5|nr:arginine--tRNA ligase [Methanobrevibacter sp. 87.7]OWT33725.1 arginine--tRNA ligase [Methanobrevibacter sp. 87.7]
MYNEIEKLAINALYDATCKLDTEISKDKITLEFPPNHELGDLASTVAFQLAPILKKSPAMIAQDIAEVIECPEIYNKVEAKGPYVNFFIDYNKFAVGLLNSIHDDYGQLSKIDEKIVLEHTSANPNGPLHIGHIRNSIIGDSLTRLLKASGREVETQYYVNDMGRQLAMVVYGIKELGLNIEDQGEDKVDHNIGQIYLKVNQKFKEDPSLESGVDALIKEYEKGDNEELNKLFEDTINKCLDGVKATLKRMHIKHDKFVWEGTFVCNGDVDKYVDEMVEVGYARMEDVLRLKLGEFGIKNSLVLRRADGTSLYSTRDIAYHMYKCDQGDIVLDILGADHKLAFRQVKAALEILEKIKPNSDDVEVLFYEFITLPEGSMSSRTGNFISVDELIDESVERAKEEIKSRRNDLSEEDIDEIAEEIGIGAIRFFIAKLSPEKHIKFKWEDALNFERGCASIQYAHARASKLLSKAENQGIDLDNLEFEDNWEPNELESDLVRTLAKYPKLIADSAEIRRIHPIAAYCQELASDFNKFYKSNQVVGSEFESSRLILVEKAKTTLKNALDILGVAAPERM